MSVNRVHLTSLAAWSRPAWIGGGRRQWPRDAALPAGLMLVTGILVLLPAGLSADGRMALFAFALAVILWSTTRLSADYVAMASVMLLVISGATSQEQLFASLASDVIWLMIGAFILGGAVHQTGLAARLTAAVVGRARTVRGAFWLITTVLIPLSCIIPSTSGRAAVMIPVCDGLGRAADDRRVTRALALLVPSVILVATISSLIGAGSHLIANNLLYQFSGERISFVRWLLYGLPFGVVAAYLTCWTVCRLFLDRERLERPLSIPVAAGEPFTRNERFTVAVVTAMMALWLTEARHGLEIATVTLAGAMLLTMPGVGVMTWKDGLKTISWNLIVFVGAALVLGQSLIESGAARWLIGRIFAASGVANAESTLPLLIGLALLSLTSHIYMTSHTARAAALVPTFLTLAATLDLNPAAVMFIGTVGMDYCLTFPVSSKALLMFQDIDGETYRPADLLRLSSVLLVVHLGLILVFYFGYWRWVGLAL